MNTYDNEIKFNGNEYYLTTEFWLDHREEFHFRNFLLTDEDFNEITLDEVKENKKFYKHIESVLIDELCVCYGGAPC